MMQGYYGCDVIFNAAVQVRHNQVMYLGEVPLY